MTDAELIFATVTNDPVLSQLVGNRVYPHVLPPSVKDPVTNALISPILPALTYGLVSQPTEITQEPMQYRSPRWRFRIYSLIYGDLIPIAIALAAVFGDRLSSPFASSRIEYPASQAEGHETDTHRYWRAMDVVSYLPAGAVGQ